MTGQAETYHGQSEDIQASGCITPGSTTSLWPPRGWPFEIGKARWTIPDLDLTLCMFEAHCSSTDLQAIMYKVFRPISTEDLVVLDPEVGNVRRRMEYTPVGR